MTQRSPLTPRLSSPAEVQERLAAARAGVPFLVLRDCDGCQQLCPLPPHAADKLRVGRHADLEVALEWDPRVSRVHAELEPVGPQEWAIVDDGLSRNGTFVNGERIRGRRVLRDGDDIRVGDTIIAFCAPRRPGSSTTVTDSAVAGPGVLTDAQRRVLMALCRPFEDGGPFARPATNQQIAEELVVSVEAVKTQLKALFRKFAVEDLPHNEKRARLVELAFLTGAVAPSDLDPSTPG